MTKKIIKTSKAPAAIGPYNQAVVTGNLVYTSGQIPLDPATNEIRGKNITEQTRLVLTNLKAVLEGAGSSLDNVIKATVFLQNMRDFPAMNKVYAEFFKPETAPARSTIQAARLPKDALVEIEAVAVIRLRQNVSRDNS